VKGRALIASSDSTSATAESTDAALRAILRDVLGLRAEQVAGLSAASGLFGALPELDSMAVAGLLTEMEDRLDIVIDDDEVDGDLLETYGSLLAFADAKRRPASAS
jgi:acyl carrier protein